MSEVKLQKCYIELCTLQAKGAFERKDFQKAETYFLRAEKPDLAAKFYKVKLAIFSQSSHCRDSLYTCRRQICGLTLCA